MDGPMTPEEKAMVMQFMGQTYGAVHQQDQNIVGNSSNLTPKSQELKNMFEQTARMPTVDPNRVDRPPPRPAPVPEQQAPPEVKTITPEQAAQEIAAQRAIRTEQPSVVEEVDSNQVEFDFSEPAKIDKLISLIEKQTLILEEISLKLSNGKSVKTKQQK
tara:strand:+ start:454 stop:933 length:480 start_codon:yes stop_codon:yes gene_type:complete